MPIEPRPPRPPGCLSDLALDEWLAGEGTPRDRAAWQAHTEGCEECRARREQRSELHRGYLESSRDLELVLERRGHAAESVARSGPDGAGARGVPAGRAARAEKPRRPAWPLASGALALAAGVLLFLTLPREGELGTRTKGPSRLDFYVKSGSSVRAGAPGEVVLAGDALRFVVPRGESRYLVVLGRDSLGVTSVYFPEGPLGQRPTSAAAEGSSLGGHEGDSIAGGIALESSVVRDAGPGVEGFYAVFCENPQSTAEWRAELVQSGSLRARTGCDVADTSITKATP